MATSETAKSTNTGIEQNNADALLLAAASKGRPYGPDTQLLVIGVHGTNNGPGNVREVTERIGSTLSNNQNVGKAVIDTGFDWQPLSGTTNQTEHREIAAQQLTARTLTELDDAYKTGRLDRGKPLVIVYAGFSHGGNVALLASDETSLGLKQRGITNASLHIATMSTPAYTWGEENPAFAAREVKKNGVSFAHTHFSVPGDGVIRGATGDNHYPGPGNDDNNTKLRVGVTTNVTLPEFSRGQWDSGIRNHGAPQDSDRHMDMISNTMDARFRGLAPPTQKRADASEGGIEVASNVSNGKLAFADSNHPYQTQYTRLLGEVSALDRNALKASPQDTAATLLDSALKAGFDEKKPIGVVQGKHEGTVFAVQGDGPAGLREKVNTADIQTGVANRISETLLARQPEMQVAAIEQNQPEKNRVM